MTIHLLEKPDFMEYLETGVISEKYKIDTKELTFNVNDKKLSFEYILLEIHRDSEKKLLYIYVSFENVSAKEVLEISEVVEMDKEIVKKLQNSNIVSAIFSIDAFAIDNFIAIKETSLGENENIFDIKDLNNQSILLNFKNYKICDILF